MLLELAFAYSCKNIKKPVIGKNLLNNSKLNGCILGIIGLGILLFLTPLRSIFNLTSISIIEFLYCMIIVIVMLIIDELLKPYLEKKLKDE